MEGTENREEAPLLEELAPEDVEMLAAVVEPEPESSEERTLAAALELESSMEDAEMGRARYAPVAARCSTRRGARSTRGGPARVCRSARRWRRTWRTAGNAWTY